MNTIIYVGGFRLPDKNASAVRVLANAKLLQDIGYRVILVGKVEDSDGNILERSRFDNVECLDIRRGGGETFPDYTISCDYLRDIIEKEECGEISAVIAYNYPLKGWRSLLKYLRSNNITSIIDSTEWYGWDGKSFFRDLLRVLSSELRMRFYYKKADKIICISHFLANYYKNKETVIWPHCLTDNIELNNLDTSIGAGERRTFIYCGSPGVAFKKDLLNVVIGAFYEVYKLDKKFTLKIIGLTQKQYLDYFPEHKNILLKLSESVFFLGRLPRVDSLNLISNAHFSVFIRPNNRVCNAGLATKLVEAFLCAVPTITNRTSDNSMYVRDGLNGYLSNSNNLVCVTEKLVDAIDMSQDAYCKMKTNCMDDNPFEPKKFRESVRVFFEQ